MPIGHKLSRKLHEILGVEAAEEMVDWMNEEDARSRDMRQEMRADFAELRQEMHAALAGMREEMRVGFAKIDARFAMVDTKMAERNAELLKWAFGFWIASLTTLAGVMAALAKLLR